MFDSLEIHFGVKSSVFSEMLIAYSYIVHLCPHPCASANFLDDARITGDRESTTEMVFGFGLDAENVGVRYA